MITVLIDTFYLKAAPAGIKTYINQLIYCSKNLKNKKNQIVATVLECRLETGRTHQIRVHLTEKGNPLIGDRTYGRSPQSKLKSLSESTVQSIKMLPGQALHAQSLGFLHPKKEKMLHFLLFLV